MAIRSALHQAGATALTQLLQFAPPAPEQRRLPCSCGHTANYLELRGKTMLTAVGTAQMQRPYYLCPHCHQGQFPADAELDVVNTSSRLACAACWRWPVRQRHSSKAAS